MGYSSFRDLEKLEYSVLNAIIEELNTRGAYSSVETPLMDSFFRNWGYLDEGKDFKFLVDNGYNNKNDYLAIESFEDPKKGWFYILYSTNLFTSKEAKNILEQDLIRKRT